VPLRTTTYLIAYGRVLRLAIARRIRLMVAFELTLHSRTRITDQPARRSRWETLESRCMFASIFSFQNLLLLRGRYLHEHPCQKHPSTNTATFRLGHAKSGRPTIGQCFRYPRRPDAQRIRPNANSVVLLPLERTEAMILDRISMETWSMRHLLWVANGTSRASDPRPRFGRMARGSSGVLLRP
jgi:hypothetical protein